MMLASGPLPFVIPAKAGIHLSACEALPMPRQRRNLPGGRVLALPWIPAFAGMAGSARA